MNFAWLGKFQRIFHNVLLIWLQIMIFSDALQGYARYPINAALQTLTKLFLFEFFGAPECY